jgi:hypothetical protein
LALLNADSMNGLLFGFRGRVKNGGMSWSQQSLWIALTFI